MCVFASTPRLEAGQQTRAPGSCSLERRAVAPATELLLAVAAGVTADAADAASDASGAACWCSTKQEIEKRTREEPTFAGFVLESSLLHAYPPPKSHASRSLACASIPSAGSRCSSRFARTLGIIGQRLSTNPASIRPVWLARIARPDTALQKRPLRSLHTDPQLLDSSISSLSPRLSSSSSSLLFANHVLYVVAVTLALTPSHPTFATYSPLTTLQTPTQTAVVILSLKKKKTPVVS